MKGDPSNGFKNILIIIDVFTRMAFGRKQVDKTPQSTAAAMKEILENEIPKDQFKVTTISTDRGNEFKGAVDQLLSSKGIIHRFKQLSDPNALAVVDKIIQTLKNRLTQRLSEKNTKLWDEHIDIVIKQYNATEHQTVRAPPKEVADDETLRFMLLEDNAEKFKQNQSLFETRKSSCKRRVLSEGH